MKREYKLKEVADILGVTVQRLSQLVKKGVAPVFGSPAKMLGEDVQALCKRRGVKFEAEETVESSVQEVGNGDGDSFLSSLPSDEFELKNLKIKYEILQKIADIERKKKEGGKLLEVRKVGDYVAGLGEGVRGRAMSIYDGIATAVEGMSPAQIAIEVEKRVHRYLKDLAEMDWDEFSKK